MQFEEVILLKYGEIVLKGLNKSYFEGMLIGDVKERLAPLGSYEVSRAQSTVYVVPRDETAKANLGKAYAQCRRIFGIVACSRAATVEKDMEKITALLAPYTADTLRRAKTFKVEAKRADKKFPFDSPAIAKECGGVLLQHFPHLRVDVKNPEVTVTVEIRDYAAYLHCGAEAGAGGLPHGSAGKGLLMLSGGIDSPVAGFRMARRGLALDAVHFESYPYTSVQAREKVVSLAEILSDWCGDIHLNVVSVTKIQEELMRTCREEYFTLLLRRFMMKIADTLAVRYGCGALITGESLGQVASQTVPAITVTTEAAKNVPVLRPLIADDKEEIVRCARAIGTFETSVLPYEDCCTVFTPKHPVTKPVLEKIIEEEKKLDCEALIAEALTSREHVFVKRSALFS